jgi:hypothetical protein
LAKRGRTMKTKLDEIYESKIVHNSFLDKESVVDAMTDSYILGLRESEEKYNKLKLAFESLLDYWGDYGNYNASRNHMEEMWREEAGI